MLSTNKYDSILLKENIEGPILTAYLYDEKKQKTLDYCDKITKKSSYGSFYSDCDISINIAKQKLTNVKQLSVNKSYNNINYCFESLLKDLYRNIYIS